MSLRQLVKELVGTGVLKSPALISAFEEIDRKHFVVPDWRSEAYLNQPLPTQHGQTISQPWTVAFMLEKLGVRPGEKVLDIGAGSGWQTTLLSYLVSHDEMSKELPRERWGKVIGLELIPDLVRMAAENVSHYNFISKKIAEIHCRNGAKGFEAYAPYDRIISAASGESIPEAWKSQLKVGGRIVAPLGTRIVVIDKMNEEEFKEEEFEGFLFVPLVSSDDEEGSI